MNILFTTCWLGEPWRIERHIKWLNYHLPLKDKIGFDRIVFVDNASDMNLLKQLNGNIHLRDKTIAVENNILDIYRYEDHLPRTGTWSYPYCWRALQFLQDYLKKRPPIRKVIILDTDFYILSQRLSQYINNLKTGWVSFHCPKYNFPEAAMNILCKDAFDKLLNIPIPSYTHYNNQSMEYILPFTEVTKNFIGDRYGEGKSPQTKDMDYYGQWSPGIDLIFNKDLV